MTVRQDDVSRPVTLTPVRRSANARSLLLTVLGEHVLPDGGRVWTSTVLDAMAALGVGAGAARQALARTAEAGLLDPTRVGRRTRWDLTARARALLVEGTERIYAFGRHPPLHWDGQWLLVLVTVPEADRRRRHQVRTGLGWAGFGPLGPGTWVSPWVSREAEVVRLLQDVGLAAAATVFVSRLGVRGQPQSVAARAWDLDGLDASYRTFLSAPPAEAPSTPAGAFAALTMMVHDWRHFPAADPDLPVDLLPPGWAGTEAALRFHDRHRAWAPAARAWWAERG